MSERSNIPGIYVPGLGDDRTLGQDEAVKTWSKHGIDLEYHAVGWADDEPFENKLEKLLTRIDELSVSSGKVALIGASAGAGIVLNAAAARIDKVRCVVSVCGKIRHANFSDPVFVHNPAFAASLRLLPKSLEMLGRVDMPILSVNSLHDARVPREDTIIDSAAQTTLPIPGHVIAIAYAITLGKRRIAKFIKCVSQD